MNVTTPGSERRFRSSWAALPTAHQVARAQELGSVVVGEPLALERAVEHLSDAHPGTSASSTKRSSGTESSSPARWASSKKRTTPCRSRGPKW